MVVLAVTIWVYCIAISRLDGGGRRSGERGRPRESGLLSGPKEQRMRVAATKPKATFSYGWNRQGCSGKGKRVGAGSSAVAGEASKGMQDRAGFGACG